MDPLAGYAIAIFAITIIAIISNVIDGTVAALIGVVAMVWLGAVPKSTRSDSSTGT